MKIFRFMSNKNGMSRTWTIITLVLAVAASAVIGALIGKYVPGSFKITRGVQQVFEPPFGGKKVIKILVLGEDKTGTKSTNERGLSDMIMLTNLNLETKQVSMLSIPRDTKITLEGYGHKKINAAYKLYGPDKSMQAVYELTGIMPDYYIETNVNGFKKTVDLVGGVDIDVEKNMHYTDNWGGLHINLKKGMQHLNGEKAMEYVRFRHDAMGDIWRVQRQQKFFVALAKRLFLIRNLPKLPQIAQSIRENVDTNLTAKDLYELAKLPGKIDISKAKTATLPGAPESTHGGYWVPDEEKIAKTVQDLFYSRVIPGLPKVEVLNGSGVYGAAQKVADALAEHGYEITRMGNADSFKYKTSQVISHKKDLKGLEELSIILNSKDIKLKESNSDADVTVIIGQDCALIQVPNGSQASRG